VSATTFKRMRASGGFPAPIDYGGVHRWPAELVIAWKFFRETVGVQNGPNGAKSVQNGPSLEDDDSESSQKKKRG
jgi:hypothetical protein